MRRIARVIVIAGALGGCAAPPDGAVAVAVPTLSIEHVRPAARQIDHRPARRDLRPPIEEMDRLVRELRDRLALE